MTGDITLPAAILISLATILSTIVTSWGVVRFQVAQHDKRLSRCEERCDALGRELSAFKIHAEQRFVADETLTQLEKRVIDAIDRLADRLDRIIEARASGRRPGV